ncbi:EthD family reductase [Ponticoccus sp. (in: a-proteobacteria)]|uniref:EthD family reductase n=1 Tax=Ponticoccus sp. (in: a-proteobacteria) TaxID=1925025 RepID=UPI003AB2E478
MARIQILYTTPADAEAFDAHYRDVHTPMVMAIPGLKRLVVSKLNELSDGEPSGWYMSAELHFASNAAMDSALQSPESKATDADFETFAPKGTIVLRHADEADNRAPVSRAESARGRGEDVLRALWGEVFTPAPGTEDFMNVTIDHLFGDLWSRPNLAMRDRSLITIAALTALGRFPQLEEHLEGGLNLGITPDELKEIMLHLAHYGGWPVGVSGLNVAMKLFERLEQA